MDNITNTTRLFVVRCPDWQDCSRKKCAHNGIHKPDIDCYIKAPGSIRPEVCPDCKVEGMDYAAIH